MQRLLVLFLLCPLWLLAGTKVLVTVAPYKYFVERIAGQSVQVQILVPAGASPHSFEPSARDLVRASQSQLWLRIGEPFEKKSLAVLKDSNPHLQVIDMRQGVISCTGDHCDNHIWLSVELVKIQAKIIKKALAELQPQNEPLFQRNLELFISDLERMSADFKKLFAASKTKAVLVSHPAFAYFCRDYGLQQISVEHEGREPTIKQTNALIIKMKALGVKTAIIEPEYQNKGTILIADELRLRTYLIDPYAESWSDNMNYIAQTFSS